MSGTVLNCGYVPLVDCAPLVIAAELGFAADEGLTLNLVKQPSWSALRDMLALGHLDVAQMLSPLPIAMTLGLSGMQTAIDCLMVLSVNGTVFGVSNEIASALGEVPFGEAAALRDRLAGLDQAPLRIGVPFPFSMHRLLLSYWAGSNPNVKFEAVTIPPPRMADAVSEGQVDAFWVGEPWGSAIVHRGLGRILMTGRDVWGFAPEKVLATRHDWVEAHADETRRLMRAIFHAARWLDADKNKPLAVEILGRSEHLNLTADIIDPAVTGFITPAQSEPPIAVDRFLVFHAHAASFPWRSQAALIADQLGADSAGVARAKQCFRADLFRANLGPIGVDLPGASEKIEGSMRYETAVASTRGHMILAQDAFFDGKTHDFAKDRAE